MGFVESVGLKKGHYLAMFHDDGRFYAVPKKTGIFTLFKTFSEDGGLTWKSLKKSLNPVSSFVNQVLYGPRWKKNRRFITRKFRKKIHIIFSEDEGKHGHLHENCLFL